MFWKNISFFHFLLGLFLFEFWAYFPYRLNTTWLASNCLPFLFLIIFYEMTKSNRPILFSYGLSCWVDWKCVFWISHDFSFQKFSILHLSPRYISRHLWNLFVGLCGFRLLKGLSFLLWTTFTRCRDQSDILLWAYFWTSFSVPLLYVSIRLWRPRYLDRCAFIKFSHLSPPDLSSPKLM